MQTNSNESDKQKPARSRSGAARRSSKAPDSERNANGQPSAASNKSAKSRRASAADKKSASNNAPAADKKFQHLSVGAGDLIPETDGLSISAEKLSVSENFSARVKKFSESGGENEPSDAGQFRNEPSDAGLCGNPPAQSGKPEKGRSGTVSNAGGDSDGVDCSSGRGDVAAGKSNAGRRAFDFIRITGANQHNLKNVFLSVGQ